MLEKIINELDLLQNNAERKKYLERILKTYDSDHLKSLCASTMLERDFVRKYYHPTLYQKIISLYNIISNKLLKF
jgi:hypothetical protein